MSQFKGITVEPTAGGTFTEVWISRLLITQPAMGKPLQVNFTAQFYRVEEKGIVMAPASEALTTFLTIPAEQLTGDLATASAIVTKACIEFALDKKEKDAADAKTRADALEKMKNRPKPGAVPGAAQPATPQ